MASPRTSRPVLEVVRVVAAVIWTLTILTLCWLPKAVVHRVEGSSTWFEIHNFDKGVHCAVFLIFSLLWVRVMTTWQRYILVGFLGLGLAALTEIGQLVPFVGRDASVADGGADMLGCVMGLALVPLLDPLLRSMEARLIGARFESPIGPL